MTTSEGPLTLKWFDGTLTREDVRPIVAKLVRKPPKYSGLIPESTPEAEKEAIDHIVHCLYRLYEWSRGIEKHGLGPFLQAIVKNSLSEAYRNADDTNWKYIHVYLHFIYNHAPGHWRTRPWKV